MINVTSSSGTVSLLANSRRSVFASLVMCYPSTFSVVQVGTVFVYGVASARGYHGLVGTPNNLSYVSNVACAAKCVITGSGLSVGAHFRSLISVMFH